MFRFCNGKNRFVIVIPRLDVALKFPKIYLFRFLRSSVIHLKAGNWKRMWRLDLENGELKWLLFKGLLDNWNEFRACHSPRRVPLFQTTYLSIFGIVNFQRAGIDIPELTDLWMIFCSICTDTEEAALWKDIHHFSESGNFCLSRGTLKIRDYGSAKTREAIDILGEGFFDRANAVLQKSLN